MCRKASSTLAQSMQPVLLALHAGNPTQARSFSVAVIRQPSCRSMMDLEDRSNMQENHRLAAGHWDKGSTLTRSYQPLNEPYLGLEGAARSSGRLPALCCSVIARFICTNSNEQGSHNPQMSCGALTASVLRHAWVSLAQIWSKHAFAAGALGLKAAHSPEGPCRALPCILLTM